MKKKIILAIILGIILVLFICLTYFHEQFIGGSVINGHKKGNEYFMMNNKNEYIKINQFQYYFGLSLFWTSVISFLLFGFLIYRIFIEVIIPKIKKFSIKIIDEIKKK